VSVGDQGEVLGRDHLDVAITLNNLAVLYKSQGRNPEAELLYRGSAAQEKEKQKGSLDTSPPIPLVLSSQQYCRLSLAHGTNAPIPA
jgi:hypothetical protein